MAGRIELIEFYTGKASDLQSQIEAITSVALAREDKTLSDSDREALARLQGELVTTNRDLESVATEIELNQRTKDTIKSLTSGPVVPAGFSYRSEGQALVDLLLSRHSQDQEATRRYRTAVETYQRAAQHMGTTAAGTTPTAGGFDGIIVHQVLGPIVQLHPTDTPFLSLLGPRNVPGVRFSRPRLVDPDLLTAAGPHAGGLEKGEVPSKKWDYSDDVVPLSTIANFINLSYEASELVADSVQMVIDHLRLRTALGLETRAVTEAGNTGNVVTLAADADAKAVQQAVWDAMARVFIATGQPATWMTAGPLGTAMLGSTVDLANRPLFPFVGPANAIGTADSGRVIAPFGLQFAETFAITDTTIYVGNGKGLEVYVRWLPVLQAVEPSVIGVQIGVAAMAGFFHPTTKEAGPGGTPPAEYNAIVQIAA
jgi:hypothetical protein